MTIKQWEEEISKLPSEQLKEISSAINSLRGWRTFEEKFGHLGVAVLDTICKNEIITRRNWGK